MAPEKINQILEMKNKEINRGAFSEIEEVDEENTLSGLCSMKSVEKSLLHKEVWPSRMESSDLEYRPTVNLTIEEPYSLSDLEVCPNPATMDEAVPQPEPTTMTAANLGKMLSSHTKRVFNNTFGDNFSIAHVSRSIDVTESPKTISEKALHLKQPHIKGLTDKKKFAAFSKFNKLSEDIKVKLFAKLKTETSVKVSPVVNHNGLGTVMAKSGYMTSRQMETFKNRSLSPPTKVSHFMVGPQTSRGPASSNARVNKSLFH